MGWMWYQLEVIKLGINGLKLNSFDSTNFDSFHASLISSALCLRKRGSCTSSGWCSCRKNYEPITIIGVSGWRKSLSSKSFLFQVTQRTTSDPEFRNFVFSGSQLVAAMNGSKSSTLLLGVMLSMAKNDRQVRPPAFFYIHDYPPYERIVLQAA